MVISRSGRFRAIYSEEPARRGFASLQGHVKIERARCGAEFSGEATSGPAEAADNIHDAFWMHSMWTFSALRRSVVLSSEGN